MGWDPDGDDGVPCRPLSNDRIPSGIVITTNANAPSHRTTPTRRAKRTAAVTRSAPVIEKAATHILGESLGAAACRKAQRHVNRKPQAMTKGIDRNRARVPRGISEPVQAARARS